ncbi:MAG: Cgl0159 family (beta/alpha)8-fold protein [Acidimicrobiia bacterium]
MITDQQFAEIVETRARRPEVLAELARGRKRRPEFDDGRSLFLITADDPARASLQIGANPVAMGERKRLLGRLTDVLADPAVDGIVATPDIVDDLLLLGSLHDKLVLGSTNRSGLAGSSWEIDDRFTAFDVTSIVGGNLDGGKLTLRLDWKDAGTNRTMAAAGVVISELARAKRVALLEPLPGIHEGCRPRVANDPDYLIRALSVAAGLGAVSVYTWLKVPLVRQMETVLAATSMPVLVVGGDPGADDRMAVARWQETVSLPQVRGIIAGRSLLFPADGDPGRAVAAVAEALGR